MLHGRDLFVCIRLLGLVLAASGTWGCLHRAIEPTRETARPVPTAQPAPEPARAPESIAQPDPLRLPCDQVVRLEVRKAERTLTAECAGGGRRAFPIALSREPVGAKRRRGDQRIPEGDYHIAGPSRPSRFFLFIPIDYPSVGDADLAFRDRVISASARRRIVAAHAARRMPPQDTALGGLVGFHGEGERWRGDLDLDWTEGCVALTDETIRWISDHAPVMTPVSIRP